jgi:hypothetical protein
VHSCIYLGRVRHRRFEPVEHAFAYRVFMLYLDLAELPALRSGEVPIYAARFSPASFCRDDHFGDPRQPLDQAVRARVEDATGRRPAGPIRLLTNLRQFGYYFSPLNLYYCFDPPGRRVEAVLAEVTNTPLLQRHCYVLGEDNRLPGAGGDANGRLAFRHPKAFHVSPFIDMAVEYQWRLNEPGERLAVSIDNDRGGRRFFTASLELQRRPLDRWRMTATLLRHPAMSLRITAGIYWQALRLWRKGCRFHTHPQAAAGPGAEADRQKAATDRAPDARRR